MITVEKPKRIRAQSPTRRKCVTSYREAIGDLFFEVPRWLDIRFLWSCCAASFFRVNFWRADSKTGENRIYRSAFVRVDETRDGLRAVAVG